MLCNRCYHYNFQTCQINYELIRYIDTWIIKYKKMYNLVFIFHYLRLLSYHIIHISNRNNQNNITKIFMDNGMQVENKNFKKKIAHTVLYTIKRIIIRHFHEIDIHNFMKWTFTSYHGAMLKWAILLSAGYTVFFDFSSSHDCKGEYIIRLFL